MRTDGPLLALPRTKLGADRSGAVVTSRPPFHQQTQARPQAQGTHPHRRREKASFREAIHASSGAPEAVWWHARSGDVECGNSSDRPAYRWTRGQHPRLNHSRGAGAQIKEGAVGPLMVSNVNAKVPEGQDDQARLKVFKLMIAQTPHRVVQTQDRAHPVTKTAPTPTLPPRRWRRTLPRALGNKGTDPPRQRRVCLDSAVLVLAPDLLEQFCERSRLRHIALAAAFKSFGSSLTARLRWACRSLWRGTHRKE
jgi:hypothetical protein